MALLNGFSRGRFPVNGVEIAYAVAGSGPPVLLLHGFPQTHAMWHGVAPHLTRDFTVVLADLRGYGDSTAPPEMTGMSFREMASDQLGLMRHLGFDTFHLLGHDRGARTAFRLALDAPEAAQSLTLMDIVPTHRLLTGLTYDVAKAYYHWFFLAQPAPLPEDMIAADPNRYYESCLSAWGPDGLRAFHPEALAAYRAAWARADVRRAMCDDYRAAIAVDLALDAADLGRRLAMPALVLYGSDGLMDAAYDVPATWSPHLANISAEAMPGGHFFPDTHPRETAEVLARFLGSQPNDAPNGPAP